MFPLEVSTQATTNGIGRDEWLATAAENLVPSIRWAFLYLPGAVAIHFIVMAFALSIAHLHWPSELLGGTIGTFLVASFMVMAGMGKLTDLRHLRSVGGVVAASLISAVIYLAALVAAPGDYFGIYSLITLSFALLGGYLLKEDTDRGT